MVAVAAPRIQAQRHRAGTVDLATAKSLKRALEKDFSAAVSPISVLETYCEYQPSNRFAQSLREIPLRHLDGLMAAQDVDLLGQAIRGRPLGSEMSRIIAQSGAKMTPRMSVGYRLAANDSFALEVRLQHADLQSYLYAQTLVKRRAEGEVPIGLLSKVTGHSGVHPAALNNDPLTLGSSVAHVDGGPGTLGLFVQMGKKSGFLSCSHVLSNCGNAKVGDAIHHPAPCDSIDHEGIASLRAFVDLRGDGPFAMDAAFAELAPSVDRIGNIIPKGQNWPSEGRELGDPVVGNISTPTASVAKIGRSSGWTTGVVALENVGPVDIYMRQLRSNVAVDGLIEVHWASINDPFSALGDSGSIVYLRDSLKPVGIVVAGGIATINKVKIGVSYVCPLGPILKEWGLKPS
jgi:hypothetical protein